MSEQYYKRTQPSQRQLQVGASIHRIVIEALAMDEAICSRFSSISFSGVRMTGGLKNATIMFTTTDSDTKKVKQELNKLSGYFRKMIASELNLRFVPQIGFQYDRASAQLEILHDKLQEIS